MSANPFPPGFADNLFKFGRVVGLAVGVESIIWNTAGPYTGILATEKNLSIVSSSDLDRVGQGGATQLTFLYQGEDGLEQVGVTSINGTTPVDIPDILADVSYRAFITASENNDDLDGSCIGDITCYETGTPANILWKISAGEGQTLMCFYRVPSNKFLSIEKVKAFPQGLKPSIVRLRIKTNKTYPWRNQGVADVLDVPVGIDIEDDPQVIRPGAYVALTVEASIINTEISGYFVGHLEDYPGAEYYGGSVPF